MLNAHKDKGDGTFMLRNHEKDMSPESKAAVLGLIYRGRPTHHLIQPGADGNLTVNGKVWGTPTTSMQEVWLFGQMVGGWGSFYS